MLKKLVSVFLLLVIVFSTNCYADDLNWEEAGNVWEEIRDVDALNKTEIPKLNSKAAIIFDRTSKTVIYGRNINDKRAMASTTKIMTSILVLEKGDLNKEIEVCKKAAVTGGSRLGLKTGDKLKLRDLLYGLLLRSGNDAAVQIAIEIGGSIEGFADLMNEKAKELGLNNTHFVTPHGLDNDNHYTTAYEMALLTDYALENKEFAKIVGTKQTTITINGNPVDIHNTNELLGNLDGVNGVKTGFTSNAGRCLVTSCKRGDLNIITVVLGADTKKFRTKDSIELIEYTYKNYTQINIKNRVQKEFEKWQKANESKIAIIKGKQSQVKLKANYCYDYELYPINKLDLDNLKIQIKCVQSLEAPIKADTEVGEIHIILNEKEILVIPIVVGKEIERKDVGCYFEEIMGGYMRILLKNTISQSII